MFCDEHGTVDYCPECLKEESKISIEQTIHSCYSCPMQNNDNCKLKMIDVFHAVMNKEVHSSCPLLGGVVFKSVVKEETGQ